LSENPTAFVFFRSPRFIFSILAFAGAGVIPFSFAQTPAPPQSPPATAAAASDFDKQSLAVRTALHFDPSLDSPLKSLIALYRNANRLEELVGLYRGHIAQYPADAGAKAVLIRVLRELGRAEADELAQSAVQLHADELPLLHFLHYESRARRKDARALESLARAVDLETRPSVRNAWAERLLKESAEGGPGLELARAYLEKARQAEGHTAETLHALGDQMHRHGFHDLAVATLTEAEKLKPVPELTVEIELLLARSQAALGDRTGAGARLASLGAKLAADHWRRQEITNLRVSLLTTAADRSELIDAAKKAHEASPGNEAAALEYADVLTASELPREALGVLRGVSDLLPQSERVEQRMLALLDRLVDAKAAENYLTSRLEQFPKRSDLRFRLVKALHAMGRGGDTGPHLDQVLAELPAEEADRHLIELARHLRDSKRGAEAAKLYQRAVEAHPERFDLRRELAETHLAREDAAAARAALKNLPVGEATIENFLDLIEFMIASEFLGEARAALESRLALSGAEGNLDLSLPLATLLAKTGDRDQASTQIEKSRALADTPARYRAWLEAGLGAHGIFGDLERFFDDEQQRLLAGGPTPDRSERFLIFCELGEEKRLEGRVNQALRAELEKADIPADLRLRLRRLLVKGLERSPERAAEAEEQLQLLAKEDPARSSEYDLRRALMYHTLQRPDLARTALEAVKIESVTELPVLRAAHPIFVEYGMPGAARHCLEKLTESEPANLVAWQRRLSLLAGMGDEEGLRSAIRTLLASGDKVALGPKSIETLRRHLLDSLWRSVSRHIGAGTAAGAAEALALLETVNREAPVGDDRLWSLWAKAQALGAAGRSEARDAAIVEFAALAKLTAERSAGNPTALEITFPDGLSLPLDAALSQLTEPVSAAQDGDAPSQGPIAAPELAWVFEADPGVRILQLEPVNGSLMILDDAGTLYRVDRASGKLIWRETFRSGAESEATNADTVSTASIAQYHPVPVQPVSTNAPTGNIGAVTRPEFHPTTTKVPRRFVVDAQGRLFLPVGREIEARSVESGALLWTADLGEPGEVFSSEAQIGLARPETQLHLEGNRLLAFVPETSLAAAIDLETGKLLWESRLETPSPDKDDGLLFSLNCGSAARDGRFFVFGRQAAILDAATGGTLWRFGSHAPNAFPLTLREVANERSENPQPPFAATPPGFLDHQTPNAFRADAVKSFLENPGALLSPAAHWTAARLSAAGAAHAEIAPGGRLLLFGDRGFRAISLALPLASRSVSAEGEFLGAAGHWGWLLSEKALHRVDLRSGSVETIPHDLAEPARGVLSGGRIYAVGSNGVAVFHAHDGSRIGNWAWPAALADYLAKNPVTAPSGETSAHLWQGAIHTGASGQTFCLPARDRVFDETLFVLQGDRVISALRAESPKLEAQNPK
jgi:thioredoxin-like negative regulator of GroEL/outer membrane protein assembly factor BamB